MAVIPRYGDRERMLGVAGGGAAGLGAPVSGSSTPPPMSPGGQSYSALRAFFSANQPAANAGVAALTAPVAQQAQGAVDAAAKSATMTGNEGQVAAEGAKLSRDAALGAVNDLSKPSTVEGLLGAGRDATYTQGMRAADAYLYGRAPGMADFQSRWAGVLGALNPTWNKGGPYAGPEPRRRPKPIGPRDPTGDDPWADPGSRGGV